MFKRIKNRFFKKEKSNKSSSKLNDQSKETNELKKRVKYYSPSDVGVIVKYPESFQ